MSEQSITITPTPEVVVANGVVCRLWEGRCADGTPCGVLVASVGFAGDAPAALRAVLVPVPPPVGPINPGHN